MNKDETCANSGTNLTQPGSPDVHAITAITRDLLIMRNRYGAESPEGHICSNIVQQLKNLKTWVRPEWATHEMQTLPYQIKEQIRALAMLTGRMQ